MNSHFSEDEIQYGEQIQEHGETQIKTLNEVSSHASENGYCPKDSK